MKKYLKRILIAAAIVAVSITGVLLVPRFTASQKIENTIAESGVTIHYKWNDGTTPRFYYTNMNDKDVSMTWPGVPMNQEADGWYSYTVKDAANLDFQIIIEDADFQTATISCEAGEYWFDEDRFVKNATEDYKQAMAEKEGSNVTDAEVKTMVAQAMSTLVTVQAATSSENITIHYTSDWSKVQLYAWNALPNDVNFNWPGETLEKDSDGYYSYTFTGVSKVNFLFSNGTEQSEEYSLTKAGEYTYKDGKWISGGETPTTEAPVTSAPSTDGPETTPAAFERTDFRDETIYFVITTRFYDGDSSNNAHCQDDVKAGNGDNDPAWRGDFKGLIEKLDYIKALGFSAIWITPVVKNNSSYDYHGYHAYNFSQVDGRYESSDCHYQDLINAAHEKGMKIIQDVVFNHTCNYGEENLKTYSGGSGPERVNAILSDDSDYIYHHKGYTSNWESEQVQYGHLAEDCIDLNTENPKVTDYLVDCYSKYIKMGVDAFRVDTVKHISRLTFNKALLPQLVSVAKESGNDKFYMFGEACVRRNEIWNDGQPSISVCFYTWREQKEYAWGGTDTNLSSVSAHYAAQNTSDQPTSDNAFLRKNEYHTPDRSQSSGLDMIDFYMHWGFISAGEAFNRGVQEDQYFNDSTWNVTYVDSHDYAPDGAPENQRFAGTQDTWAENLDLMFTFRGIPCIFYGSEIEFQKGKVIDVGPNKPLAETGRAYYGNRIEGSVNVTDFGVYSNATGAMVDTLNYPLAKHIQRLNLIRRAVPALRKGQYSTEGVSGGMAYKRRYTDSNTDSFVCVTISGDATFSGVPSGTYVDMITGDKIECSGTLTAKCSGKGNMRVYVLQTKGAPNSKIGEDGTYLK